MKTTLFENLRKLVTIIDELRDIGLQYIKINFITFLFLRDWLQEDL